MIRYIFPPLLLTIGPIRCHSLICQVYFFRSPAKSTVYVNVLTILIADLFSTLAATVESEKMSREDKANFLWVMVFYGYNFSVGVASFLSSRFPCARTF